MTPVPEPTGQVGRIGMVAALRGVKPSEVGRLVLVRLPVGLQPDPRDRRRKTLQWQVLALGAAVAVNGRERRDLVVPDDCLRPLSQLDPRHVGWLVKARALADFRAAAADLGRYLKRHPMSWQELDQCVARAGEMAMFEHALQPVPVVTALAELGFVSSDDGSTWRWSAVHRDATLTVFGGADMFERWSLVATCNTAEVAMWEERVVDATEPRGKVISIMRDFWRTAFGSTAPLPAVLSYAEDLERHQRDMCKLKLDAPPTLWVDGEMLRATRRVMADRHGRCPVEVGPLPDVPMTLAFDGHLLHLEVGGCRYAVQARGVWIDDCSVSLREFLDLPPQRMRGNSIAVEQAHDALGFNRCWLRRLAPTQDASSLP